MPKGGEAMQDYEEHIDLAAQVFERAGAPFDPKYLSSPVLHEMGPQVIVVQEYCSGPGEIETLAVVGFYVPHDGQCTVVVNHLDGMQALDNADLMFPEKKE
jgi:hypothetical protein